MSLPRTSKKLTYPILLLTGGIAAISQPALANPAAGRLLAAQCAQCHGTNGSGGFEALAGRNAASLYRDLLDMKHRPIEGIMDRQARGYTDQQLWLIAEYFAAQQGTGESESDD